MLTASPGHRIPQMGQGRLKHLRLWCPLAAERPNSRDTFPAPVWTERPSQTESKLTPAVSKLIFPLLLLLLSLGGAARRLCERVRVSLSHMGHHGQEEAGAAGKGLGRFTVRRLPRQSLGTERIVRGSSERRVLSLSLRGERKQE